MQQSGELGVPVGHVAVVVRQSGDHATESQQTLRREKKREDVMTSRLLRGMTQRETKSESEERWIERKRKEKGTAVTETKKRGEERAFILNSVTSQCTTWQSDVMDIPG